MKFNDRSQMLFANLMALYLNDGKPVGSSVLAKLPEVGVSSATVRNVMADLEKMGLIHSPHTSAGRVPTDQGYRVFVDKILTVQPMNRALENQMQHEITEGLQNASTQDQLLGSASSILSDLTGMASVVLLPNKEQEVLRHIDFVKLGAKRVLVVLVLNEQDVQNRMIELESEASASQLEQVANYLNTHFAGRYLSEVKSLLVSRLDNLRQNMDQLMLSIMEATDEAIDQQIHQSLPYFLSGQTNLLNYQELAEAEKLKALFQSFEEHNDMLKLFNKSLDAKGMQIFIGNECGNETYQNCSVITTPYESNGEIVGVLGVVGPSRMPYDKIVPKVDMTARILSSLLNK